MLTSLLRLAVWLSPNSWIKRWLLNRLGCSIAPDATAGVTAVWGRPRVTLGPGAVLASGNVLYGPVELELGAQSLVGRWNWISAAAVFSRGGGRRTVTLGEGAAVTNRHYIDGSGGVSIGRMTTVAGHRSTFLTHGIDPRTNTQVAEPIVVGEFSLIGSDCRVVPGSVIADHCVIAMGSVVTGDKMSPYGLYAGVPAERKDDLAADAKYFHRIDPNVEVVDWQAEH